MQLMHRRHDHPNRARMNEVASEDNVLEWAEKYARENGWVLNPDRRTLGAVIRGLARKRFGTRYCPCRLSHQKDTAGPETPGDVRNDHGD